MRILAMEREQPGAAAEDFRRLARAEAARAWELYQAGLIRELYFREDRAEAVLLLECAGAEEAAASLATLPFVAAGLITFDIIPLVPYPGFARLFAGHDRPIT
jgi:muconolactone delta-isomerase